MPKAKTKTALLVAYQQGKQLTDSELEVLGRDMRLIATTLADYGGTFRLTTDYANKIALACHEYLRARSG